MIVFALICHCVCVFQGSECSRGASPNNSVFLQSSSEQVNCFLSFSIFFFGCHCDFIAHTCVSFFWADSFSPSLYGQSIAADDSGAVVSAVPFSLFPFAGNASEQAQQNTQKLQFFLKQTDRQHRIASIARQRCPAAQSLALIQLDLSDWSDIYCIRGEGCCC